MVQLNDSKDPLFSSIFFNKASIHFNLITTPETILDVFCNNTGAIFAFHSASSKVSSSISYLNST